MRAILGEPYVNAQLLREVARLFDRLIVSSAET